LKTTLKHITTIQTGVFAKPIQKGEIVYLQAKHFDENGELSEPLYPDLNAESKIHKHLLKKGDVLFAAKGTKNFAACYENEEIQENEFNLNIPRYVDTFEEEAEVDIAAVQKEIENLEGELKEVQGQMDIYLKELMD
jgi:type I restriction-modification system DNA methylase subunit